MPSDKPKRIAVITGTRAEWGLLSPVVHALQSNEDAEPLVIVTNMHLMERYGLTIKEIEAEGITPAAKVAMTDPEGDARLTVKSMAECMSGMADAFVALKPDMAVILGDRFEMLAAASAALTMGIPIAHIAGGEQTLGAIDDKIRHAITQMATYHFTETEAYRDRVISMGANPANSFNVGALGVANALQCEVMSREDLAASVGLSFERPTILVTFHAATADEGSPEEQFAHLLRALDSIKECDVLLTYPNNDPRGRKLIGMLNEWVEANADRAVAIPSLGKVRYLSALRYVAAVAGNSSSGIIEVPSAGTPTVNIGSRQEGRISAESVIHCAPDADKIEAALRKALSPEWQALAREVSNPYEGTYTVNAIVNKLLQ